jgi:UDP-2,3-diacylglucosamine pyrophosphatase LpxH
MVQFADLHFGEGDEKDELSIRVMQDVLTAEPNTDLVVFSGDQVSGWLISNPRDTLRKWADSLRVVNSFGIPFATIFGNHDDQAFENGHIFQYGITQGVFLISLFLCLVLASRHIYFEGSIPFLVCMVILVIVCSPSNVMQRSLLYY